MAKNIIEINLQKVQNKNENENDNENCKFLLRNFYFEFVTTKNKKT